MDDIKFNLLTAEKPFISLQFELSKNSPGLKFDKINLNLSCVPCRNPEFHIIVFHSNFIVYYPKLRNNHLV